MCRPTPTKTNIQTLRGKDFANSLIPYSQRTHAMQSVLELGQADSSTTGDLC